MLDIEQVIREFLVSLSENSIAAENLSYQQSLIASGLIDSFAVVEILDFLEERFDVTFDADDLTGENFDSIATIARLVRQRVGTDG